MSMTVSHRKQSRISSFRRFACEIDECQQNDLDLIDVLSFQLVLDWYSNQMPFQLEALHQFTRHSPVLMDLPKSL